MRRLLAMLVVLGAAAAFAPAAYGQVYKWVDENGLAHYTMNPDGVPKRLQSRSAPAQVSLPPSVDVGPGSRTAANDLGLIPEPAREPGPRSSLESEQAPFERAPDETLERNAPVGAAAAFDRDAPGLLESEPLIAPQDDGLSPIEREADDAPGFTSPEIRELEHQIARDRELMKSLISQVGIEGRALIADPRFLEIAERLPRLQSELESLREESAP